LVRVLIPRAHRAVSHRVEPAAEVRVRITLLSPPEAGLPEDR
jgi:hypothetical protein